MALYGSARSAFCLADEKTNVRTFAKRSREVANALSL